MKLLKKLWQFLRILKKKGGFIKQLFEGTIQRKIAENANKEQRQFDEKDLVLLGTNKLPNKDDKMKEKLELYPFIKTQNHKTEIEPIIAKRLAEKSEKERLEKE